jgi:hypothetical protein
MWKTRIFTVFSRSIMKKTRFSSVFRGFSLAFSKSLGYSAQRPGFFGASKGESPRLASRTSRLMKKSGG